MTIIAYYDSHHSQGLSRGETVGWQYQANDDRAHRGAACQKGLQGASFSEILEASGAPRGSLYYHFPGGKDELVLAALEHAGHQALGVLDRLSGKPAREVAEGFLSLWRSVLARSDFSAGCAVVAVTVAAESEDLRARAAEILRSWREKLATLFVASGTAE